MKIYKKLLKNTCVLFLNLVYYTGSKKAREHSSAGRASALQAEGHRFEPYCSHHKFLLHRMREWLSGRALPCQGKCREFESRLPLHFFSKLLKITQPRKKRYCKHWFAMVPSPSGKARVCKTLIPSSNLGGTSNTC